MRDLAASPSSETVTEPMVIGVLTGGRSRERDRSLQTGGAVAQALRSLGHQVDIIDTADSSFGERVRGVSVAFLALAGRYAEDGRLQGYLETVDVRYTGSGVLASALAMHKPSAKTIVAAAGVPVLPHVRIDPVRDAHAEAVEVLKRLDAPVIVKPESEGSSIDITVARSVGELADLIAGQRRDELRLFAEPFVQGRSVTVGVLETQSGPITLPVVEVAAQREFYDHTAKLDPSLHTFICPAILPPGVSDTVTRLACLAHRSLGCAGYSRSDFVIATTEDGATGAGVYWLEANTLPGLRLDGTFALMAKTVGMAYEQLIARILDNAWQPQPYAP